MPTEFTLPELGENIAAGDVVRVLVSPGDTVAKDQPVLELETDKATIEVPSSVAGTVGEVRVKPGDKVKVGQVVLTVDDGAGGARGEGGGAEGRGAKAEARADADEARPKARRHRADRRERRRRPGRPSGRRASAARAMSSGRRASTAREAEPTSRQRERPRRRSAAKSSTSAAARAMRPAPPKPAAAGPAAPAAPSVRRLARELGVDIRRVPGQRPGRPDQRRGRAAVREGGACRPRRRGRPGAAASPAAARLHEVGRGRAQADEQHPPQDGGAPWQRVEHRSRTSRSTTRPTSPASRRCASSSAPQAEKAGGKLTVTAIALKIVAAALQQVPAVQLVDRRRQRARSSTRSPCTSASPSTPSAACWCRSSATSIRRASSQLVGGAGEGFGEGARRQAVARRHAGRRLHDHEPRRHRRHLVHADRQLARGRDPRHVARRAGAGLERPGRSSRG